MSSTVKEVLSAQEVAEVAREKAAGMVARYRKMMPGNLGIGKDADVLVLVDISLNRRLAGFWRTDFLIRVDILGEKERSYRTAVSYDRLFERNWFNFEYAGFFADTFEWHYRDRVTALIKASSEPTQSPAPPASSVLVK